MARRVERITIRDKNRDHGKVFVITEMPADQAEWWAARALLALTNAGAEISEDARNAGMAGLAAVGLQSLANLKAETVKPLMDEMFDCVQYEHNPSHPLQSIIAGENSQIEEVSTRVQLRRAVLELHVGFSLAGAGSTTASGDLAQQPGS
jgi:hypothetical protein